MAWCMLTLGYNLSIAEPLPGHRTQGAIPECATCGVAKMTVSGIVTKFPQSRYPLWTESVCRTKTMAKGNTCTMTESASLVI